MFELPETRNIRPDPKPETLRKLLPKTQKNTTRAHPSTHSLTRVLTQPHMYSHDHTCTYMNAHALTQPHRNSHVYPHNLT